MEVDCQRKICKIHRDQNILMHERGGLRNNIDRLNGVINGFQYKLLQLEDLNDQEKLNNDISGVNEKIITFQEVERKIFEELWSGYDTNGDDPDYLENIK